MTIHAFPPDGDGELGHYANWLRLLVLHEVAHIVHIDISLGIPEVVNHVFGRLWKPNQVLPSWLVEGIAVWAESRRTGGGRLRSPVMDAWLRAFEREGDWPSLSELGGFPLRIPRATLWYLLGGHIVDTMVAGAGEASLRDFVHAYGERVLPFALHGLARRATGHDWEEWYRRFRERRGREVAESLAARQADLREGEVVRVVDDLMTELRFSPDGRWLVWVESDGHRIGRILRAPVDLSGAGARLGPVEEVAECFGGCAAFDISRDGGTVAYTTSRFQRVGNLYGRIALAPFGRARERRAPRVLPGVERAQDLTFAADGRSLWVVRTAWGRTWLDRVDLQTGSLLETIRPPHALDAPGDHPRIERPVASADGDALFILMQARGNRDLWRIQLDPGAAEPIFTRWTRDGANELDLQLFRGHGAARPGLVVSADRGGVHEVLLFDVTKPGHPQQLTLEPIGAFAPALSPDGAVLAYVRPSARGRELRILARPLDGARPAGEGPPLRPVEPMEPVVTEDRPYDALPTLTPRRWFPSLSLGTAGPGRLGFAIAHTDASRRWDLGASFDWDFAQRDWAGTARVGWRGGFVDASLDLGRYVYARTSRVGDVEAPWLHEVVYASTFLSLPVPDAFASLVWGLGYTVELERGARHDALVHRPDETTPFIPAEGASAFLNFALSWNDTRAFLYSPGTAEGTSGQVNLSLRHPSLGSRAETFTASFVVRGYAQAPWHPDHVAMIRLGGGITGGADGVGSFTLGGAPNRDLLSDLLNQTSAGSVWLRGFPVDALRGSRFLLGTFEYRAPILRVRASPGTLPIFLEDLSVAAFADFAATGSGDEPLDVAALGVGLELRARVDLAWGLVQSLRFGVGRGFGPGGTETMYLLLAGPP